MCAIYRYPERWSAEHTKRFIYVSRQHLAILIHIYILTNPFHTGSLFGSAFIGKYLNKYYVGTYCAKFIESEVLSLVNAMGTIHLMN